ncbi:unnamed protein product [Adineta steineri]|uniref:LicD/FKTN/FKRP nucleotidyltransferase domain-containing protein n=1 Tax=Adineta steineri TaxID=433720 RepID=A0A818YJ95_9BILA|nr:unnamed protein product [Adineta steineri]CAF3757427.1 unnamed protein product [Adineta steineri]
MGLINKKLFILFALSIYILLWMLVGFFKQSINSQYYQNHILNSNISLVLEYISKLNINLLLIDPVVLDYLFIRHLSLQKRLITFGILNESIPFLDPLFSIQNFSITLSTNMKKTSIDHIFIEYNQQIIHLAILHKQNSYFLIHKNTAQLPIDIKLSYGDTLRILEPFESKLVENKFSFPRNVSHFLWLYNTSEFLECNQNLANHMENKYNLYQNKSQLNLTILPMRTIVNALNNLEKHHWLAGGTLLGWYRHCGLIPYTQDMDFGLFAEEYDDSIRNYFLGNPTIYLWGTLGLVNDSLEFRLFTGSYTFDLFWAYREGNYRWYGYQIHRTKYKRKIPLIRRLCSCDLFGYRFSIPCSPINYLNNEYGYEKWKIPLEKNYTWINVKYNSIWNDISWMYAVRLYTREGKVRTDKYAIDWIANQFNYSLKTIPTFLNISSNKSVTFLPVKN